MRTSRRERLARHGSSRFHPYSKDYRNQLTELDGANYSIQDVPQCDGRNNPYIESTPQLPGHSDAWDERLSHERPSPLRGVQKLHPQPQGCCYGSSSMETCGGARPETCSFTLRPVIDGHSEVPKNPSNHPPAMTPTRSPIEMESSFSVPSSRIQEGGPSSLERRFLPESLSSAPRVDVLYSHDWVPTLPSTLQPDATSYKDLSARPSSPKRPSLPIRLPPLRQILKHMPWNFGNYEAETNEDAIPSVSQSTPVNSPKVKSQNSPDGEELNRCGELLNDKFIVRAMPFRVFCDSCRSWVSLDDRIPYHIPAWLSHKKQCVSQETRTTSLHQTSTILSVVTPCLSADAVKRPSYSCQDCGTLLWCSIPGASFTSSNIADHRRICPNLPHTKQPPY